MSSISEALEPQPTYRGILDMFLKEDDRLASLQDEIGHFILDRQPTEGYKRRAEMMEPLIGKILPVRQLDPDPQRVLVLGIDLLIAAGTDPSTPEEILFEWVELMKGKPFDTRFALYKADGQLELFQQ